MDFNLFRLAVLSLAICASAAQASGPSITVSSRGLNLNSPAGATAMLARIERAASSVCGGDPAKQRYTSDTRVMAREYRKCMKATVAEAVQQLHAPLVQQSYAFAKAGWGETRF